MLTNPVYGGAYAYGKTERISRYEAGATRGGRRQKPRDEWLALIPERHEGYLSWVEYERVQAMIKENFQGGEGRGAVKHGAALLAGLLRCRRCGRKLTARYTGGRYGVLRYTCDRSRMDSGEPKCIAFGGIPMDAAVAQEVLRVVEPLAVEAAVLASQEEAVQQDEVLVALRCDLEAASYAARRAEKQYDAADPENRLVVDELERRWNEALHRVHELEHRIEQHLQDRDQKRVPTLEEFEGLAVDLKAVWDHPATDVRLRKRILRTLIDEVIADIDSEAGEIVFVIHWKGGVHTELRVHRRRRGQCTATSKGAIDAVRTFARVCSDEMIAGVLNRNGLRTGRGNRWTRERVTSLRSHHQISCYDNQVCALEGWMTLTQAAHFLGVSPRTLRLTAERGEIDAEHPLAEGPWVFNRFALTTDVARRMVERVRQRIGDPTIPNASQQLIDLSIT